MFVILLRMLKYNKEKLKHLSRYIFLPSDRKSHTFKNVHPGTYYIYAFCDFDGNRKYASGDYMSSKPNQVFSLKERGHVQVNTIIDYVIP